MSNNKDKKSKKYSESDGYLKSDHWKAFIKEYWNTHDECELCGAKKWKVSKRGVRREYKRRFVVHHKDYKHLYKETWNDVQGLCARCHNLSHEILRMSGKTDFVKDLKEVVGRYFSYDLSREK